jgi:hypothetical protein
VIENAAVMAAYGLPAWRYITTQHNDERVLLLALAHAAERQRVRLDRNLAVEIVNALIPVLNRIFR